MSTDVEHSLDFQVLESLDFEDPCTHPMHDSNLFRHSGKGEWYYTSVCPNCKKAVNRLICNKYKLIIFSGKLKFRCSHKCGEESSAIEWITKLEKK